MGVMPTNAKESSSTKAPDHDAFRFRCGLISGAVAVVVFVLLIVLIYGLSKREVVIPSPPLAGSATVGRIENPEGSGEIRSYHPSTGVIESSRLTQRQPGDGALQYQKIDELQMTEGNDSGGRSVGVDTSLNTPAPAYPGKDMVTSNKDGGVLGKSNDTAAALTRNACASMFGKRSFLPAERKRLPPILYTFPGSGNTWCRLLIEYATGIYTGSVYNDKTLLEALPGEFTCNWQVSAVKVHPHTHGFEQLRTGKFNSDAMKCKRGGIKGFERAVLLIRDPFDSIWSEYQRRLTQSHVGGVKKKNFDWHRWQANAAALANDYYTMWSVHHAGIERHFSSDDILYVKYEDLKSKERRVDTLSRIVRFLRLNSPDELKLNCAFLLADNRQAHRKVDSTVVMTKQEAYTRQLVCRMWSLFGSFAEKHDYKIWQHTDCSSDAFPPIPRVRVGPQGEYNKKWVKPGMRLIDFGGHPNNTYDPKLDEEFLRKQRKWKWTGKGPRMKKLSPKMKAAVSERNHLQGKKLGAGSSSMSGGAENDKGPNQLEIFQSHLRTRKEKLRRSVGMNAGGMTVEQATSQGVGVANVGLDKPAWDRRP